MSLPMKPFYRYELRVEIPATEVAVLVDALDGDELSLKSRLGEGELRRQLEEHAIEVSVLSDESWPGFQREIETLSSYLSEPISGREVCVRPGADAPVLEGWVILGSRGQSERLALDLGWDAESQVIVDRGVDMEDARRRWSELEGWVRTSLVNRHPELGRPTAAA